MGPSPRHSVRLFKASGCRKPSEELRCELHSRDSPPQTLRSLFQTNKMNSQLLRGSRSGQGVFTLRRKGLRELLLRFGWPRRRGSDIAPVNSNGAVVLKNTIARAPFLCTESERCALATTDLHHGISVRGVIAISPLDFAELEPATNDCKGKETPTQPKRNPLSLLPFQERAPVCTRLPPSRTSSAESSMLISCGISA